MGEQFKKHFPGDATLEETCRACKSEVLDGEPKRIISVEGVIHEDNGTSENLNEATFEIEDDPLAILTMLNDFLCFDVSTTEGASDAEAASKDRTNVGGPGAEFNIWVEDTIVPVQILGKLRSRVVVPAGSSVADIEAAARSDARIQELLAGKTVVKVIVAPGGKLVNFVVK